MKSTTYYWLFHCLYFFKAAILDSAMFVYISDYDQCEESQLSGGVCTVFWSYPQSTNWLVQRKPPEPVLWRKREVYQERWRLDPRNSCIFNPIYTVFFLKKYFRKRGLEGHCSSGTTGKIIRNTTNGDVISFCVNTARSRRQYQLDSRRDRWLGRRNGNFLNDKSLKLNLISGRQWNFPLASNNPHWLHVQCIMINVTRFL